MLKIINFLIRILNKINSKVSKAVIELSFIKYGIEFGERDKDIYIVSYPRSGTTMMQMLLYQITTDGSMDFNHIYDVSPWTKNDAYKGLKPKDFPDPRIIKSHDEYYYFDKDTKGKFIFLHRDGMDVAVSLYHQRRNYINPDLEFEQFIDSWLERKETDWFKYNKQWFENKRNLNVLHIKYEDLIDDFDEIVRRIVSFIEIDFDWKNLNRVKERCSFEFMKINQSKFGEQPALQKVYDNFIRKGVKGEGKLLFNEVQRNKYHELVKKIIIE